RRVPAAPPAPHRGGAPRAHAAPGHSVTLPTAPCTSCRQLVVYGQRRCHSCGATFDYGPSPPPEPTAAQVREALGLSPEPPPSSPPSGEGQALLDRGRYEEVPTAKLAPE